MKRIALVLTCMLAACASTYAADPTDPVDMAAELGNRGRAYVGMGEVCDAATSGAYRQSIVQVFQGEQARLGSLAGLVNRAYAGRASRDLVVHMQAEMNANGLSAVEFCGEVVRQAEAEAGARTTEILALRGGPDMMTYARDIQRPHF